jgi:uncharacterized membrane protein YphA (DoxX/SURF4 family)
MKERTLFFPMSNLIMHMTSRSPMFKSFLRIVIGALFVLSGLGKLMDLGNFAQIVASYSLTGPTISPVVAGAFSLFETVMGLLFIADVRRKAMACSLAGAVGVITILSALHTPDGTSSECGCFGGMIERKVNALFFVENILLFVLLCWLGLESTALQKENE